MTNKRRKEYDVAYMKIAKTIASLSYANRNKVGCVIVSKDDQIISQGFNGTPAGYDNCCEDAHCSCKWIHGCAYDVKPIDEVLGVDHCLSVGEPCKYLTLTTKPEVLHAESNAISKCSKYLSSTKDATLYVTLSPCFECSKMIIQAGISRVVYEDEYRDITGIDFLKKNGIRVERLKID